MNSIHIDPMKPLFIDKKPKAKWWVIAAAFVVPAMVVVGLLFLLITLQGGLETGLSNLARLLPVGFAVAAGIVATVNPCGVLMLPSYALYQVGGRGDHVGTAKRLTRALLISALATVGFVAVFALVGAGISAGGQWLIAVFPYAGLLIGVAMVALGIWLLITHRTLGISAASRVKAPQKKSLGNAFVFGITYAMGSLSCTLPIFLVVVGGALGSGGPLAAFGQFLGYALGMASVLVATILGTSMFQQAATKWLNQLAPYVHRISAMFLIGSGAYLVYYWISIAGIG